MPTSFIALQCFQCSTMQVKQQKKSSNKWTCVVCNEKQSVRKVFAQAFMAKEVRKFVQNFNMSRQLSDQKQLISEELEPFDSPKDEQKRKRTDWTAYLDDEDEYCRKLDKDLDPAQGDDALEPMVVTETPKSLSKKPKVNYSSNRNGSETLLRPLFPNSSVERHKNVQSQEWNEFDQASCGRISKRDDSTIRADFRAQVQDDYSSSAVGSFLSQPTKGLNHENNEPKAKLYHMPAAKGPVSKWSCFITEEDDDELGSRDAWAAKGATSKCSSFLSKEDDNNVDSGRREDSWDHASEQSNYQLESLMEDERVEDDVHPDFL